MTEYFSDKYNNSIEKMEIEVWNGIVALYVELVSNNNFAKYYPENCPDGGVSGTNKKLLETAIKAEIPNIEIPIKIKSNSSSFSWGSETEGDQGVEIFPVLDFIEFLYHHLCKPVQTGKLHEFFNHFHLSFEDNIENEQEYFREKINTIFHRNKLPYTLNENGKIIRLTTETAEELIRKEIFNTPDKKLNNLLNTAFTKFKSPKPHDRREALDTLWDAYEQLKTHYGANKGTPASIKAIVDSVSYDRDVLKEYIAKDAEELNSIGNKTDIRHKNTDVEEIEYSEHVDYLFFRMSNLIHLMLQHFEIEEKKES